MISSHRDPVEESTRMTCDECLMTVIVSMLSPIYQECVELFMVAHASCKDHEAIPDMVRFHKILQENPDSPYMDIAKIRVHDSVISPD